MALAGSAADTYAQGVQTGTIRGTITDQQNLPVPGVNVTISSPALQGQRNTVSAGDGSYVFRTLPPGAYQLRFEISSFAPAERTVTVPLGLVVEQNIALQAAGVAEQVQVVAETPAPLATPIIGANYKNEEINLLATPRTLSGIAQLAPGLNENSPNAGQVSINGAFAFDNVFMLNGVDVNDNLFGSPQDLFIEDAIEETQVLTSGISAEYGRFTGGVVNAITKSGGNTFTGSFRTNLSNPAWTVETPREQATNFERPDDMQRSLEATFGGPIVRDRLWFFTAGRHSELSRATTFPETNIANTQIDTNKRGEIKFTGTAAQNHTFQGGYLNNATEQASRPTFSFSIDPFTVGNRTLPNWYSFINYRGVLRNNLLVEGQFSNRKFGFRDSGGSSTSIIDSPFITLTQDLAHYNAQYFDATDPENRNNQQITGNVTYFAEGAGRHEIKGGYEFFRSQRTGGNSQSPTGFVFDADWLPAADGTPALDATGHLIPVFVPGATLLENWRPVRGAELNVDNNSLYIQDHWAFNANWSFDLGVRYERARSQATGGIIGVDTDTIAPRLAASYDLRGDGNHVVHFTYGHYSGRYNESQIGGNNNVGNPDLLFYRYRGPAGQGRNFAPGFDINNYQLLLGQFPTANIFLADGLSSPIVKEFTASYGVNVLNGKGWVEGSYVHRDTDKIIEDFIDTTTGTTTIIQDGEDFGTFTNTVYDNSEFAFRRYDGLLFQARYNLMQRWTVNGHYTLQLRNEGNYNGENTNQPGLVTRIGDYPEIFTEERHYPTGRLPFSFQRHKVRLWTIYNQPMGRFGDLSASALYRLDSKGVYSFVASGLDLTDIQLGILEANGYVDQPSDQDLYFGERGAGEFPHFSVTDFSLNYNIPVFRDLRPWVKFDVYNLFNNQDVVEFNTTVNPDPNSPLDALGNPTGFIQGSNFGRATSNEHYPIPFTTQTGGRTYRVAVGFRF
jgi:outer membrane receptor protein involved in Fe transport